MRREELEEQLRAAGYGRGVPAGLGVSLDRERAAELVCVDCEHKGLEYVPFIRQGSYVRSYACPKCGAATYGR